MCNKEETFEKFYRSIKRTNDSGLYKYSRKFPELSPDTIDANFSINPDEDKILIRDQNINNIIIETRDYKIEFIKQMISNYKEKINQFNPKEKRLIIIIFIYIMIELDYKLDFSNNYDVLYDHDYFPSDPTQSELFDFIRKMNYLLYKLYSNIGTDQQGEMLDALKSCWVKNDIKWIYNFFPFFNEIIKECTQQVFILFINSNFFTDIFLSKSETDPLLFLFVSKITQANPKVIFNNEKILNHLSNYIKNKDYRKSLVDWLSIGLKIFSQISDDDENNQKTINKIFSLYLEIIKKDDLDTNEKKEVLNSIIDSFLPIKPFILSNSQIVHQILIQLSSFSTLSTDVYFTLLDFLSKMNDKFEIFDNPSFNAVFDNLKSHSIQKVDLENLWNFTLKKGVNNELSDNILNWRGIELILSYFNVDEIGIFDRIEKLIHIKSNLYEFQKANLTEFIVNHFIEIQKNSQLTQFFIIILELMITFILTEKDLFLILELIKSNNFDKSVEVLQLFLNVYQKDKDIYNPSSFFRFDRDNQYLYGPFKKVVNSDSICFAFKLTQKVNKETKNQLISISLRDEKKLFTLFVVDQSLEIEMINKTSTSVVNNFKVVKEEWNFIEIQINNKFSVVKLRFNQDEKYTEYKLLLRKTSLPFVKKDKISDEYQIAINSSAFDYSNIFVMSNNNNNNSTSSFYSLMSKYNMDIMNDQNEFPNLNYILYSTNGEGVKTNSCKYIKNYQFDNSNSNSIENINEAVYFKGRTITNVENIFDFRDTINIKKFFFLLFEKLNSSSSFNQQTAGTFILKLQQFFEASKLNNPKIFELYSIIFSKIDPKFLTAVEFIRFYDLSDSLISEEVIREFYQSFIFNFKMISKLPEKQQLHFFKNPFPINYKYVSARSFDLILFNAIEYYGTKSKVSKVVWNLLKKVFDPNNENDMETIIVVSMKNISDYITTQCVMLLTDTITQIEPNEQKMTKKLFSLSVFLTSLENIELQTLGVKLFILIERYFNIAENRFDSKKAPINSIKYIYQMIFSSNVNHETSVFDQLLKDTFNYLIPGAFIQDSEEKQIELKKLISMSSTTMTSGSINEITLRNVTIFPLIVFYCSFCSNSLVKELITIFNSNVKNNDLSSFLDLNSWCFWILNFLFQYIRDVDNRELKDDSELDFLINPLVDFFTSEITFQSSVKKIIEFFTFLRFYSNRMKFNYRQIELLILIKLLNQFKNSEKTNEIALLYPIIYSCLQVEIKDSSFKFSDQNDDEIAFDKDENLLLELFTNRYSNNFQFTIKSTNANNQTLRLLLIETVLNFKENVPVQLVSCNQNDIYFLTSFILVDFISENSNSNNEQLLSDYIKLISNAQNKTTMKYKKCSDILSNVSNEGVILDYEKRVFTNYFQESKKILKSKLKEATDLLISDFTNSEILKVISIEKENKQRICLLLLKSENEFKVFLNEKVEKDKYEKLRDEKIGREHLRNERIYNSFISETSKDKIERKFKILNQISHQGTRSLMSVNNNYTNHTDIKLNWLGNININQNNKYKLSKVLKSKLLYFDVKLTTIDQIIDGIISPSDDQIIFYSAIKTIHIYYNSIEFIFSRSFSNLKNNYECCEVFTNQNRSFYFIFNEPTSRSSFYSALPDYGKYTKLLGEKYGIDPKKLNSDETVRFDFFYALRKSCNSIYQTQPSSSLCDQLKLSSLWQDSTITNYEYIYYLNMIGNRSYHTKSFYPYYPLLLRNYDSDSLDICDESNYRDLSIPVIIQYDNPPIIKYPIRWYPITDHSISFLMGRIEPFTAGFLNLNSQRFDHRIVSNADPTFVDHSSPDATQTVDKTPSSELIPEVFTVPFYLVNENNFDLNKKDGDVKLPKWSHNHFTYTFVQRLLLEGSCTSRKLSKWIDITFGCNQNFFNNHQVYNNDQASLLLGCLPDKLYSQKHPERQVGSGKEQQNLLFLMRESTKSNQVKEKLKVFLKSKIVRIEKEFIYFKNNGFSYVADVNQIQYLFKNPIDLVVNVPNDRGELLCVSRPLKLAIFGTKYDDFLTVVNLQKKSISVQCHIKAKILCAQTIGGRYLITGGSDCVLRVWDMLYNYYVVCCSCYHEDEIIAVAGCRSTGLIASIDRSMNLVVETLFENKLINFVRLEKENITPLLQVTKAGLIIVGLKEKILILDSRGKEIKNIRFKTNCEDNQSTIFDLKLFYDFDTRELLIVGLKSGQVLLIDLTIFDIIGQYDMTDKENTSKIWSLCSMKKCRAVLLSDGEKIQALLFDKLISPVIKNIESNQNIGTMEALCFNYQ